ncbi:MAG: hypothetical protein EPO35_11700 [Acidobacteria bacterium]|nr:MAG: hypothetical protein EPO35_11700 [Acidobacteriota bacterium]
MKTLNTLLITLALALLVAPPAAAQYSAPKMNAPNSGNTEVAVGEKYHIQFNGGLWNPTVYGLIASSQFGITGTQISFEKDLKFAQKRFKEFGVELRPTKRNKFYAQYTPITYASDTTLTREIVFNGQKFAVNLPVKATYDWKVWRIGYEIDVVSMSRGFVGLLFEAQMTEFGASVKAPATAEFTKAKGPLPALGLIARAYPVKNASITAQVTGLKVPDVSPDYQGSYADWNIYGTFNVNQYAGVQAGWRRVTTNVVIKKDSGNTLFKGIWFGAVVRY